MKDKEMRAINVPDILNSLDELSPQSRLLIFGAGETGQEFVKQVSAKRPDIEIVCFIDSYRNGLWENIPIREPACIEGFDENVELIIASVFWSEIAECIDNNFPRAYKILSNNIINQASHLSSFGDFYFDIGESKKLETRLSSIKKNFRSSLDQDILRMLFDLRTYRKENEFFSFSEQLIREQKMTFETLDKYTRHLDFDSISYVIEGGVYDGQDTYRFLEMLKRLPKFKKLYAFDPFLDSLHKGKYFKMIDSESCEFHDDVLWDCEERVSFRVDQANPANSTVIRESEMSGVQAKTYTATSIDVFLEHEGIPVDLIKLDVEGAEINVLNGAKETILKWKPKIAVSVYHRREHLLEIPELLLSLHKDYKFSLSVNNPTFVDMVLYGS